MATPFDENQEEQPLTFVPTPLTGSSVLIDPNKEYPKPTRWPKDDPRNDVDQLMGGQTWQLTADELDVPGTFDELVKIGVEDEGFRRADAVRKANESIARYVAEQHQKKGLREDDLEPITSGNTYEELKDLGLDDSQIIELLTTTRDIGPGQQFLESTARTGFSTSLGAGAALAATGPGALPLLTVGLPVFVAGSLLGDYIYTKTFPESAQPVKDPSASRAAGEVVGGGVPTQIGMNLLKRGTPLFGSYLSSRYNFADDWNKAFMDRIDVLSGNPLERTVSNVGEARATGTAAIGEALGNWLWQEKTSETNPESGTATVAQLGSGILLQQVDPLLKIFNLTRTNQTFNDVVNKVRQGLTAEGRMSNVGEFLYDFIQSEEDVAPELLIKYLDEVKNIDVSLNDLSDFGLNPDEFTSSQLWGLPALTRLENSRIMERGDTRGGAALKNAHENTRKVLYQFLDQLGKPGQRDRDSLAAFAEIRKALFDSELQMMLDNAFVEYNDQMQRILRSGDAPTEAQEFENLRKIFFDEGGVLESIQRQEQFFRRDLPLNEEIDFDSFDVEGGLNDVFQGLREEGVRGQVPRISFGRDPISIDKALKDINKFIEFGAIDDVAEEVAEDATEAAPITLREIVNLFDSLDGTRRNLRQQGDQDALARVDAVEQGLLNTLDAFSQKLDPESNVRIKLENLRDFQDSWRSTFSQAFLGQLENRHPNVVVDEFFRLSSDQQLPRLIAMQELDNIVTGSLDPSGMAPTPGAIQDGVSYLNDIQSTQENLFRKIVNRHFTRENVVDAQGRNVIITPEGGEEYVATRLMPKASFQEWLNSDATQELLQRPEFADLMKEFTDIELINARYQNSLFDAAQRKNDNQSKDAFLRFFEQAVVPRADQPEVLTVDNPSKIIRNVLGLDSQGNVSTSTAPLQQFREMAQLVAQEGDEEVKRGFMNAVLSVMKENAGVYDAETIAEGFQEQAAKSLDVFKTQLNKPIVASNKEMSSVLDVLKDTGLYDDREIVVLNRFLNALDDNVTALEGPGGAVIGDTKAKVSDLLVNAGVRGLGASMASFLYKLFGGSGGGQLVAASAGSRLLQDLLDKNPALLYEDLIDKALLEPEILSDLMTMYVNRDKRGITKSEIKSLYSFLVGSIIPATTSLEEFETEVLYGGTSRGEAERRRLEAEQEREIERQEREATREVQELQQQVGRESDIAPPEYPQQQNIPAPLPVAQAQPPAPAPASTSQRQRYAAMYPQDITSDIIRTQGIGPLMGRAT